MEAHKIDRAEEEKIDLIRLLVDFKGALRQIFWLPLALAVLFGGLLLAHSWRSYTPMYASEVTFTIQLSNISLTDVSATANYYNKATAEQMAKTFPYIIHSDLMRSLLRREMGVEWLNGTVTASTVSNTNFFTLRATSSSAQDAYDILNTVILVYPQVADYVIGSTRMDLLTEPTVSKTPYNTFRPMNTVARGAGAGMLLGLFIVLVFSLTRNSVCSKEEIRRKLNQDCLAVLPAVAFKRRSGPADERVTILNSKVSGSFQECIRSMRIKFLRAAGQRNVKVVMVTSTLPGEGKTTGAVNLALTLGRSGARVILVDMDLRKPSVKRALGVTEDSKGMPELLSEEDIAITECLLSVPGTSLRLLAGDRPADAPRQQTFSRRLVALLNELRAQADFIVLDTPPCGLMADSAAIAGAADGIVYVLRAGVAQASHVMDNLQMLAGSGAHLLGCVLNGVQAGHGGYGYGYGYGYGGSYREKHRRHSIKKQGTEQMPEE